MQTGILFWFLLIAVLQPIQPDSTYPTNSQNRFAPLPLYVYPEQDGRRSGRQSENSSPSQHISFSGSEFREACPSSATGDFPYGGDCRKYLSCWKGRGVLRLCSPGTLFNPNTLECDFPDKVTCHTHVKRSGRSDGTRWHSNPSNFISERGKLENHAKQTAGHNPHYHNHHHREHRGHSPAFHAQLSDGGRHYHHHHHHHHTHGYNGLPTYTPYDRRFDGAMRNMTRHSGVQPPGARGWHSLSRDLVPPSPQGASRTGSVDCSQNVPTNGHSHHFASSHNTSDCLPGTSYGHKNPTSGQQGYGTRGYNPSSRDSVNVPFPPRYPSVGTSGNSNPSRFPISGTKPSVGFPQPADESQGQVPEEWIDSQSQIPYDGAVLETQVPIGLQPPNQDFLTDDLPYCDDLDRSTAGRTPSINTRPSDPGLVRKSRLVLPPPTLCPQGFSGLTPHPDCSKFLSCANGRTFVMDCAPGTRFNPKRLICDYPQNVKCAYEDPFDLQPAGSSTVETHQPILSGGNRGSQSRPSYDYDIDVRFGDIPTDNDDDKGSSTNIKCRPRLDSDTSASKPTGHYIPPSVRPDSSRSVDPPSAPKRPHYSNPPSSPPSNRPIHSGSSYDHDIDVRFGDIPTDNDKDSSTNIKCKPSLDSDTSASKPTGHYIPPSVRPDSSRCVDPPSAPKRPHYSNPPSRQPSLNYPGSRQEPPPSSKRDPHSDGTFTNIHPTYIYPEPNQPNPLVPQTGSLPNQGESSPSNRPIYSGSSLHPNVPSYGNQPPRQFGSNFIDTPQQRFDGPDYKDSRKDVPKRPYYPSVTQPRPVYIPPSDDVFTRFGDLVPQESIPTEVVGTTERIHENFQNRFEVITARPVTVTGRVPRTRSTTTPTTTAPPTKQHVFRPDIVLPSNRTSNKTKSTPSWQVVRLRGGPSQIEGFVEIQITFGAWGILCDERNKWSLEEANIVCKNLGYSRGAEQSWQGKPAEGRMSKSSVIAANNVHCIGHEESILECYIAGGGSCDIDRDAVWVRCHPNSISACQPGETSFDGKCYSLVVPKADGDTSVGFSQGEALAHCRSKGARLVDFTSQQENDYLSEWLVFDNSADSVMTSGVGVQVMGHALWIWEGSEDSFSYNNWWPGWGGSGKALSPKLESGRALCVVARRYFPCASFQVAGNSGRNDSEALLCDAEYFYWDVEDCGAMSNSHPYICERPADKVGCVLGNGESYIGPANVTNKGLACLSWDSEEVLDLLQYKISQGDYKKSLSGHNSCRNVASGEALPWCFAKTPNGIRKQLCDIPKCGKGVQQKSANFIEYECQEEEFSCKFNSECIPSEWVCDGQKDCGNGADESDCDTVLNKFSKFPGKRLYQHDTERWLQTSTSTCAQRCVENKSFQCRSFSHSERSMECILSDSNIGLSGALSGNDSSWDYYELNSLTIHCTQHFLCDNGKCISPDQSCNGHDDCGDRTDEKNCTWDSYDIQIRLTGSPQPERGTVEVKFKGEWGLVCDDEFDFEDGRVMCRQLGFSDVSDILKHSVGLSNPNNLTKYLLDNIRCQGNETNIADCEHNGWGVNDCAPTETVGLVCTNGSTGGTSIEDNGGVVASNMWRCETSDELIHIDFLCDNVPDCTDKSDENLSRCKSAIEVRLVGVSRSSRPEGRLEVRRFGVWGTVCDDDFGSTEAQVVCSTLGHKGPAKAYKNAKFGPGAGVIWLDSLHCEGNETGVERCLHEGWGKTNCKHDEDVSVVCSVDVHRDGHGSNGFAVDDDVELLPEECGKISPDLHSSASSGRFSARVVSGFETVKGTYPWQASVRLKSSGGRSAHWCGAVVIGKRYALTAGHCLRDYVKSHYFIRAGDYDTQTDEGTEQDVEVEEMWIHEKLDEGPRLNNDLALVRVKAPGFDFNTWVQPACMPKGPLPKDGNCTISGWGTTSTPGSGFARTLHAAWLTPLKREECASEKVYGNNALSEGMFCAGSLKGGPDSCQGDSGGPFVCQVKGRYSVYGITSWGHGCGRAYSPGVYTDMWYYDQWITDTLTKSIS